MLTLDYMPDYTLMIMSQKTGIQCNYLFIFRISLSITLRSYVFDINSVFEIMCRR